MKQSRIWAAVFLILSIAQTCFAVQVLVVGDSHSCGAFGQRLVHNLAVTGDDVEIFCAVSSSPPHWLKGKTPSGQKCETWTAAHPLPKLCDGSGKVPSLESLLKRNHYDLVVIALGTNSLLSTAVDSSYAALAKVAMGASRCHWIGPPHLRPDQARGFSSARLLFMEGHLASFYQSLQQSVGTHCSLSDSRTATQANQPAGQTVDGVHRTLKSGVAWADSL